MKDGNREDSSKELPKCFKCNKTRHIKGDYPLFQNKKKTYHHKKAMKVIWSDDLNSNSSDEEHITNICFMASERENEVHFLDDESDHSYNELHDAFKSLYDEFRKLGSKYSSLKKSHTCLLDEKYTLKKKACIIINDSKRINQLKEENEVLKENVNKLNTTLAKFTQGSKILETMLSNQSCVFNKKGLGYQSKRNKSILKTILLKPNNHMTPTINAIIVELLVILFMHVLVRKKKFMT
jgi:cell division protein FtsB